jgi:hypothetical protein
MDEAGKISGLLTLLERRELRLLNWGVADASFSQQEVRSLVQEFCAGNCPEQDAHGLFRSLADRKLLFSFTERGKLRYRTRMAETMRLLLTLKQLFPGNAEGGAWRFAPDLVSDFRLMLRAREYPARDQPGAEAVESLGLDALQRDVARAMLQQSPGQLLDLAGFQIRASNRILGLCGSKGGSEGTIICAGTGSGKTLAFYLPGLLALAGEAGNARRTRCLALYPRLELLRDQLSEAYALLQRVNPVLVSKGRRPLSVAPLFGDVPGRGDDRAMANAWQAYGSEGHECPYMKCPRCKGRLIWLQEDRRQGSQRLVCEQRPGCGCIVEDGEILLTRERIVSQPPDILFTTTEMMNQHLSDGSQYGGRRFNEVFGLGPVDPPNLVLLDEVHTYDGQHGAQVAMLMRRWRALSRSNAHFVGLSATLEDAERFFAALTGINDARVRKVAPLEEEMIKEGLEYMVALRGDPVSQASLLSTTIQATMLLARTLDGAGGISHGLYGRKVFVFTDDLDVTNRLYFNLLDAEGRNSWGRPTSPPLANLRASIVGGGGEDATRFERGQSWDLCEAISPESLIGDGLQVGRTASQDPGVNERADVVVATASLEVGYNDPAVGCIIQHKSPRGSAQFLQRKGRAGRPRGMRPWTLVTLSDCGRDRSTFQGYDTLFDPTLLPRYLPVDNVHVLRMQATLCLLDWVARKMDEAPGSMVPGSIWRDFSAPHSSTDGAMGKAAASRHAREAQIVRSLLENGDRRAEFVRFVSWALQVPAEAAESLMWDPPRSIMGNVAPTILRRLETGWSRGGVAGADYHRFNHPLPEFVLPSLFSDLNLPEVIVRTPPQQKNLEAREDRMPVLRAIGEFSPGRISKRFGVAHLRAAHWVPVPLADGQQEVDVDAFCPELYAIGSFQYYDAGQIHSATCLRPVELSLAQAPGNLASTSNARPIWRSQVLAPAEGLRVDMPGNERLSSSIREMVFYTHESHEPVEIRRFSIGSRVSARARDGTRYDPEVRFCRSGERVALGCAADVDAFVVRLAFPGAQALRDLPASALRALRARRFQDLVREESPELDCLKANVFQRDWIALIYLAAVSRVALRQGRSVAEAASLVAQRNPEIDLLEIIRVIYQGVQQEPGDEESFTERQQELVELLGREEVLVTLERHAVVLWQEPGADWSAWLSRVFRATAGSAIYQAACTLCPEIDASEISVDFGVCRGECGQLAEDEIWFIESSIGGGGGVERILDCYGRDPGGFLRLAERMLDAAECEIVERDLRRVLSAASDASSRMAEIFASIRAADDVASTEEAFSSLIRSLPSMGVAVDKTFLRALSARVLRPGSSPETDVLLDGMMQAWADAEESLGFEVDARVWSYLAAAEFGERLAQSLAQQHRPQAWVANAIYGLLPPRGWLARSGHLALHNPFEDTVRPERLLMQALLPAPLQTITLGDGTWEERLNAALVSEGRASLRISQERMEAGKEFLVRAAVSPLDCGPFFFFPQIVGCQREVEAIVIELRIMEYWR